MIVLSLRLAGKRVAMCAADENFPLPSPLLFPPRGHGRGDKGIRRSPTGRPGPVRRRANTPPPQSDVVLVP